jgi:hypothetical protein
MELKQFLLFLSATTLIMNLFACCPSCTRKFDTSRGVSKHRMACPIFNRSEADAIEKRRRLLAHCKKKHVSVIAGPDKGKQSLVSYTLKIRSHELTNICKTQQMTDSMETDVEMIDAAPPPVFFDQPRTPSPSPPPVTRTGRPRRNYRLPRRFEDEQPEAPAPVPLLTPELTPEPVPAITPPTSLLDNIRTGLNRFRLFREYPYRPSYDPDSRVAPEDLADCPASDPPDVTGINVPTHDPPWPFANMSIYRFMEWLTTGSTQKSIAEADRIANEVIGAPDFKAEDLANFRTRKQYQRLDLSELPSSDNPFSSDTWTESTVHISVPIADPSLAGFSKTFAVPGLHHRSLIGVMKSALRDVTARKFHFSPFKRFWKTSSGEEIRCFDEVYTSNVFLEAHEKLQTQPNEPGCKLEKVVLGLMFWSDSTHLSNFGTASVWPLYLYFANLSKYFRGKLSFGASHHVAYIPSVSLSPI